MGSEPLHPSSKPQAGYLGHSSSLAPSHRKLIKIRRGTQSPPGTLGALPSVSSVLSQTHWHYPSPGKGGCERLLSLPLTGHHSLELCLGKMAPGAGPGRPRKSPGPQDLQSEGHVGRRWGSPARKHWGAFLSGLPPAPPLHTHTKPLAKPRTEASRRGQVDLWGGSLAPPASTQEIAVCLSSLLFRMPVPVRPAWNLESHRAQPIHKPLLPSSQWKTRAWDSLSPHLWPRSHSDGTLLPAEDHGDSHVPGVTRCEHICATGQGWLHGGARTRRERTRQGEDGCTQARQKGASLGKAGARARLLNSKPPVQHLGRTGSQACTMLGAGRKPFLPEVGTCGLWGS